MLSKGSWTLLKRRVGRVHRSHDGATNRSKPRGPAPARTRHRPCLLEAWQRLTPREQEVLRLIAAGETTRAIAGRLEVSPSTVRTHVEHLRGKLAVATRAALVAEEFRFGYLE